MASVTAEVLLYFGSDDKSLKESIEKLRFGYGIEDSRAIIDILTPAWRLGVEDGRAEED